MRSLANKFSGVFSVKISCLGLFSRASFAVSFREFSGVQHFIPQFSFSEQHESLPNGQLITLASGGYGVSMSHLGGDWRCVFFV